MKKLAISAILVALLLGLLLVWATRAVDSAVEPQAGTVVVGASQGPEVRDDPTPAPSATPAAPPAALPVTSDPDEYAAAIAGVVFGLDTAAGGPEDYRALLMAEADPQMSERGVADLERMVAERIPAPELWARMRLNAQWSKWQTEDVWQPGAWDDVVTSGRAEPGWVVRNVLGIQTTHFHDGGRDQVTSRERTLTIGMRCPAEGAQVDRCRLALVGIGVVS